MNIEQQIDEMTYSELMIELDHLKEMIRVFESRRSEVRERCFALAPLRNVSAEEIKQANG